ADYATHLLDVAKQMSRKHADWIAVSAIADPSTLERRIAAMLHRQRNRSALGRRGWTAVAIAALGVSIPIAAAARAGHTTLGQVATISGTILDQTGAVLPGVRVSLTDVQTNAETATRTNAEGRFAFGDLQSPRYVIVTSLPGFASVTNVITPESG